MSHPSNRARAGALRLFSLALPLGLHLTLPAQTNFSLTPQRAFQVTFPTRESHEYQVQYSTNLTNWLPASPRVVACQTNETLTFKMTNGGHAFYRGQEFPPDLTRRIPGLSNVCFDSASIAGNGTNLEIKGMRVQSRDYNLNDYLDARASLDICNQAFTINSLKVYTNVGLSTAGSPRFFLKDVTNQIMGTSKNS